MNIEFFTRSFANLDNLDLILDPLIKFSQVTNLPLERRNELWNMPLTRQNRWLIRSNWLGQVQKSKNSERWTVPRPTGSVNAGPVRIVSRQLWTSWCENNYSVFLLTTIVYSFFLQLLLPYLFEFSETQSFRHTFNLLQFLSLDEFDSKKAIPRSVGDQRVLRGCQFHRFENYFTSTLISRSASSWPDV